MNEQVVGLDIGDVRIGVAVSDSARIIASPHSVITRVGWGPDTRKIMEILNEYQTSIVVSGLPLNMDGSEGFQAKKVRDLCAQLEKNVVTVYFQDERLSTVTAEDSLIYGGMHRQDRKQVVDKVAAAVILQTWLDAQKRS